MKNPEKEFRSFAKKKTEQEKRARLKAEIEAMFGPRQSKSSGSFQNWNHGEFFNRRTSWKQI